MDNEKKLVNSKEFKTCDIRISNYTFSDYGDDEGYLPSYRIYNEDYGEM